jgi:hypothetical protein
MNLSDTKRQYRQVIDECERTLALRTATAEQCQSAAALKIDKITKSAMRSIDEYTTRRFLPINTRRGLVNKLNVLHGVAMAELDAVIGKAQSG